MHNKIYSIVYITAVMSAKSCVTAFGFPIFNLNPIFPQGYSSAITKPFQYLYDGSNKIINYTRKALPKPAGDLLGIVNPLNLPSNLIGVLNYNQRTTPHQGDQGIDLAPPDVVHNDYTRLNNQHYEDNQNYFSSTGTSTEVSNYYQRLEWTTPDNYKNHEISEKSTKSTNTEMVANMTEILYAQNVDSNFDNFFRLLEKLDRKFYQVSYEKLLSKSPPERKENGISFAQSSLFLYLELIALCHESNAETRAQIKKLLGFKDTCAKQEEDLKKAMAALPTSSESLKFRWSSRLVLSSKLTTSEDFLLNTAPSLHIHLDRFNETVDSEGLTEMLNNMVEEDSGGAMSNTFEEEELTKGICAVWLTTIYLRARWRSAPTVLNGLREFYDGEAPPRSVSMIRINDFMRYAFIPECDAEAIEIQYAQAGLSFLIMIPRERSLKRLANCTAAHNLQRVYREMRTKRVAVTLPIYTLRMTLLMPGKLVTMGVPKLVTTDGADCGTLKLSHGVQRIMFWAEAGRNAFKDDGIEWDDAPEFEKVVDRPYIFFIRWHNLTLLHGNFAL